MNGQLVSGWEMTVVGTTTVFFALSLLVAVLSVVARFLEGRTTAPSASKPAPRSRTVEPTAANDDSTLLGAVLAAYGAHRRRRVVVRPPSEASAWRLGGRSEQLHRWR